MKKKERIAELERRVAELEMRIANQPVVYYPVPAQPQPHEITYWQPNVTCDSTAWVN